MYLKRKIDLYLNDWFLDKERKPLIVKGSRQIGKTESIRHFASSHYKYYVEINFALERKYLNICSEGYDVDSIIKNITLIAFNYLQPTYQYIILNFHHHTIYFL